MPDSNHLILTRPDGATIAYHGREGLRPGVVFLGGFRSDMTGTKALYLDDYCRRRNRLFRRFDYFGHGASSGDFTQGTVGRWVDDALAIIDSLPSGPVVLVGSSMGGWIMLRAALARRERIAGLVGIAAAPDFTEELVWPRLSAAQQAAITAGNAITLPSEYDAAGYTYSAALFADARHHLVLRGRIALDCPVRLLHGMRDAAVPWQMSLRLAEALAGGDVAVTLVKDGDHRLSTPADLARLGAALDELLLDERTGS